MNRSPNGNGIVTGRMPQESLANERINLRFA